ncbi:MAG: Gx transporter family protein [Spirochaetaceae bacterium]|nr:Gx transporter family protein [Spirochaetaceae bacterium]
MYHKKIAFFAALCMFLSMIEYAIPKPIPFMRLGIANMGIMLSLYVLPIRQVLFLTLIKVFLQALISGTFFSYIFIFSFIGSFSSVFAMLFCKYIFKSKISFLGICLSGALANNLSQILLSYLMIFKSSTSFIAPILLISGFISSIVLGTLTQKFVSGSSWYKMILTEDENNISDLENIDSQTNLSAIKKTKTTNRKILKNLTSSFVLLLSIIFFSLLVPNGKLLFSIGSFKITQESLFLGLRRGLILILSVYISKIVVSKLPPLKGRFGKFINMIFLYFKELTSFEKENSGKNILKKLDSHLINVYNSSVKK